MDKVPLTIDGLLIKADRNMTVLEAALQNGIYIPHLCYHPDLKPAGVCRLCLVEIKGRGMAVSCHTPVEEGLIVKTDSPNVSKVRRVAVELLIANHHADCLSCRQNNQCELQRIAAYVGINNERMSRLRLSIKNIHVDKSNPFFERDSNRCVLCGICVRTCEELQGVSAIDFGFRGYDTIISTFGNKPIAESNCESCGECVIRCPVGALSSNSEQPNREIESICAFCGVGCGILLGVRGNRIVSVRGDIKNQINKGSLCVKGRYGYDFVNSRDRLNMPLIRQNGELIKVSWKKALDFIAKKFADYKGNQFGLIASAKCTNEENYIFQKFARVIMGTNNVDHCARLCHAPTVAGLVQSFGSGAMTNSINEISNAHTIFAIGTNTTWAHPVIGLKIKEAVRKGAKLIVANPKRIDLCRFATVFLQHKPGTDVALMMGMMRVIVDEGLHDTEFIKERCENFDAFCKSLDLFNLDFAEETTGVAKEKIIEAARLYASNKPSSLLYAMGITQHTHGTDNVLATSDLAMLTGNIGKESTGVNPLRGHNNVQGACDMGALPNVYPGYQKVDLAEIRQKFEAAWDSNLSSAPGLALTEMWEDAIEGKLKAIYLIGENPVLSEADSKKVREAIKKLEFFVVQDIFLTETAELADVVLPAASFAEKDGTFTNTERCVQRLRKVIEPIGKADWQIICSLAKKMGEKGFDFRDTSEIMDEIARITPIYGGISYDRLEKEMLQWPCLDANHPGTKYLHKDKFSRGKGRFIALRYKPSAELPDKEYPIILTTDRSLYHFHTGTMTRRVAGLNKLREHELVELNKADAAKLGISDGDTVRVISRRGKITARAKITENSPAGIISMTFHFRESPTNVLTNAALDPVSKIPETKVCAVRVEKCP